MEKDSKVIPRIKATERGKKRYLLFHLESDLSKQDLFYELMNLFKNKGIPTKYKLQKTHLLYFSGKKGILKCPAKCVPQIKASMKELGAKILLLSGSIRKIKEKIGEDKV